MNYDTVKKYTDDLRKLDEYSINIEQIQSIKSKVEIYINSLDKNSSYELSKCNFLLMIISKNIQDKRKTISSLLKSIKHLKKSRVKNKNYEAILYGYLSNYYTQYSKEEISKKLFKIVIEKFENSSDSDELIQFYIRHIKIIMNKNYPKEKIRIYIDAVHKILKNKKVKYSANYYCDIGQIYLNVFENIVGAIFYLSQSLDLAIKTSQVNLEIRSRIYLALSYSSLGNNLKSINYIEPLLNEKKYECINDVYKTTAINNLINNYLNMKQFKKAKQYLPLFKDIYENSNYLNKEQLKMISYICKAEYYSLSTDEKIEECIKYIQKSKSLYQKNKYKNIFTNIDLSIDKIEGNLYFKVNDYKKACEIHKNGLENSIQRNNTKFIIEFNQLLSVDYEKLKDLKNSIKHIKMYMQLQEKWFVNQNNKYTEILLKEYDILGKENKIYELKYMKDILIDKRNKDTLTGLLNRRFLNEYISADLDKYNSSTEILSILMIDIDYFKKYNDKYGHIKGDEVISKIGKILNEVCCKQKHVAIRYGGEEFLLLLQDTDEIEAINIAKEILSKVQNLNIEHVESSKDKKITVSIGISTNKYFKCYNEVMDQADKGLYIAKKNGKNRYVYVEGPCST